MNKKVRFYLGPQKAIKNTKYTLPFPLPWEKADTIAADNSHTTCF